MKIKITERTIEHMKPTQKPQEYRDTELKGFLARVQPSGIVTLYYEHCFSSTNKRRIRLGETGVLKVSDARFKAMQLKAEHSAKGDAILKPKLKRLTYRQFLNEHYGPFLEANNKNKKETLQVLERYFEVFLNFFLDEIDVYKVDQWKSKNVKRGLSNSSVNRRLTVLKAALNRAVDWGLIPTNPMIKTKFLKVDNTGIVRYLSPDEELNLFSTLYEREKKIKEGRLSGNEWRSDRGIEHLPTLDNGFTDHIAPIIILALNTGMRRGEILKLKWSRVNMVSKIITVVGSTAKSMQTRNIPMNNIAFKTLSTWLAQSKPTIGDTPVFRSPETGNAFTDIKKAWVKIVKDAGIQSFRFHDNRHHFASTLAMKGVPITVIRDLLGHADIKMTLRYAHLCPGILDEAVNKLNIGDQKLLTFS